MTGFEREVRDLFLLCFCDVMPRASQRLVILVCFPYYFYGKTKNIASLSNERRIFLHSFARAKERKQESTPAEAKMAKISVLGAKTPKLPDDLLFGYEISPELFP